MKIIPLAFDSFGARSMCTYVETKDVKLIIDPAVALGPKRFKLPPHPIELKKEAELWSIIKEYVKKSDLIAVTHYHYDHHNPDDIEIFKGKEIFLKHPKENINQSQKNRSAFFIKQLGDVPKKIEYADGLEREFGKTTITFSPAVYHGTSNKLGYVTEIVVDDGEKFLFSSDVEGPSLETQVRFMVEQNPNIVFIDGPMTYMLGYRYSQKSLDASINNLITLSEKTEVETIVIDHHLTRDINWRKKMGRLFKKGEESGVKIQSAAEYIGEKDNLLEARRRELYSENPVN